MALADPAKRMSIHLADSKDHQALPNEIRDTTADHVKKIGDYLLYAASIAYPDVAYINDSTSFVRSAVNPAVAFLDAFTPAQKKLKTGHLRTFTAEVVMPEEIPEAVYSDLQHKATGHKRHITDYSAYLLTTAELFSGKKIGKLGSISCIAVTGHGESTDHAPFTRIIRPPLFIAKPLTTNQTLAFAALQESRTNAHAVQAEAMQRPYRGGLMQ